MNSFSSTLEVMPQKKTPFAVKAANRVESCLTNVTRSTGVMSRLDVGTWGAPRGSNFNLQHPCQDFLPIFLALEKKSEAYAQKRHNIVSI